MAKVKAAYNYSYNYEGKKISFKKDEEFQLLNKSNNDWWQVRRYMDGAAQDIYVPAVYVKEVNEPAPVTKTVDPTYMNLDDLKLEPKSAGDADGKGDAGGGGVGGPNPGAPNPGAPNPGAPNPGAPNPGAPKVLNKPKTRGSIKRTTHAPLAKREDSEGKDDEAANPISPTAKANGLNPAKPGSPSMLRRLNRSGGNTVGSSASQQLSNSMPSQHNHSSDAGGGGGLSSSLNRGEKLFPPPTTTKPRSRTSVDMLGGGPASNPPASEPLQESSGTRRGSGGTAPGQGSTRLKLPPPIQMKPKPTKGARRPVSYISGVEQEGEIGSKPLVSELSNILMKKKPHLAGGEHRILTSTKSLGSPELPVMPTEVSSTSNPPAPPEPPAPSSSALPPGWTEHRTASGQIYYYNAATGQSSWTRPKGDTEESENKHLEKVAPRGWTKEINPITSTPVYTNSRTGERWSLASDGKGNYYYYNMANSSLTIGELPEVSDTPQEENMYDTLGPPTNQNSSTSLLRSTSAPSTSAAPTTSSSSITDTIASSLSDVLKRHGILHRKRLYDLNGKKVKDKSWLKHYVCLQGYELLFYPDMRAKDNGASPSFVFCLLQTTVSPYNKDRRKNNVFQVSSHLGEQFLLQAETSNLLNEWYSTIQSAIDLANHDYKDDPSKFKRSLTEPLSEDMEQGGSIKREKRSGKGRHLSVTEDAMFEEEEEEDINDMDISVADRSTHIRGRLRRLMARRPEKEQLRTKGILEDPVFGCELSDLCERQGTNVPKFFMQFMQHIEKVGLDVVGIYRLSGNAASVNKLRYLVEQDQQLDLESSEWSDVNIVTGCLKLYLRELPDPLLPFRTYKLFIDSARATTHSQRVQNIAAKVKDLPGANYHTLKILIQHLRRVVEMGHVNKMLATNVAIVFGPTVMRAETDSLEMATLMPIQNGIVEIMVNEFESIFRK